MSIDIITEPKVRLVGRLQIDEDALAGFLKDEEVESWTTDTDIHAQKLVEVAGRLCYKSYAKPRPGGNSGYINHILEVAHGSVIEHCVYNFIITGVSRSFSHEMVRHRAGWAYSQRSQRYCDEGELSVVVPPALADEVAEASRLIDERYEGMAAIGAFAMVSGSEDLAQRVVTSTEAGLQWLAFMDLAQAVYRSQSDYLASKHGIRLPGGGKTESTLSRKQAREAARSVLPGATETQIFVTANARALRTFLEQRGDASADAEIRRVAVAMLAILAVESPALFGDYRVEDGPGGIGVISTPYRKV